VVCSKKVTELHHICNKAKLIGLVEKVPSVEKLSVLDKSGFG
jgi:hypothetical protein